MLIRLLAALPLSIALIAGAAADATAETSQRQLGADYPNLEVRWLGDYDTVYTEHGYTGLTNALGHMNRAGVDAARFEAAAIEAVKSQGLQHIPKIAGGIPAYYEIWVRVAGCDNRVFYRASFAGRLVSMRDPAGCLGTAPAAPLEGAGAY